MPTQNTNVQIQDLFDKNELNDLKDFFKRKDFLNNWNVYLSYIFHALQSSGILVTTISAGYGTTSLIWVGVSLNAAATLIHVFEKNNNEIITKLTDDIKRIKDGTYVDQSQLVDDDSVVNNSHIHTDIINTNTNSV